MAERAPLTRTLRDGPEENEKKGQGEGGVRLCVPQDPWDVSEFPFSKKAGRRTRVCGSESERASQPANWGVSLGRSLHV